MSRKLPKKSAIVESTSSLTDDCETKAPRKREGTAVADRNPGGPGGTPGTRVPVSRGEWQTQTSGASVITYILVREREQGLISA
jgi:hypothetical protein